MSMSMDDFMRMGFDDAKRVVQGDQQPKMLGGFGHEKSRGGGPSRRAELRADFDGFDGFGGSGGSGGSGSDFGGSGSDFGGGGGDGRNRFEAIELPRTGRREQQQPPVPGGSRPDRHALEHSYRKPRQQQQRQDLVARPRLTEPRPQPAEADFNGFGKFGASSMARDPPSRSRDIGPTLPSHRVGGGFSKPSAAPRSNRPSARAPPPKHVAMAPMAD